MRVEGNLRYDPDTRTVAFSAAAKRPGSYNITVTHPNYTTQSQNLNIGVEGCHVDGKSVSFELK